MGKRHKHHTASTVFRDAGWHPPGQPHFFIDLRGRYYSQMSHLELLSRKVPEVSRAGSKCSPLSEVHNERRKDRADRAVQGIELEGGGKEGRKGKRNYDQKCMYDGFLSYCKYGHCSMHNFSAFDPTPLIQILRELLLINAPHHRVEPS